MNGSRFSDGLMFTPAVIILYEILTLLIASSILFHAAFRVYRLYRTKTTLKNTGDWITSIAWLCISIFILLLWPNSSYPAVYTKSSFLFFAAIASVLIVLVADRPEDSRFVQLARRMRTIGVLLVCFILLYSALQYLLFMRPKIITSDFFFYVCTARDMVAGFEDFSRYFYFPGIYTFWRIILVLTDGSLDSLQWSYMGILAINALLMAGIVWRTVHNIFASVIAFLWYLLFCSRFDGFLGFAEPIATVPILTGLFLWGGKPLIGKRGFLRILALGTGLGLAVYVRQLAGPVSLGAISLVITYILQDNRNPFIAFKHLILLPLIAVSVVLIGILLEGYGFQPLMIGLQHLADYGGKRTIVWEIIWPLGRRVPALTICSVIAFLVWIASGALKRFRPLIVNPWWQIAGFTAIGGFLSLISHIARATAHYALFTGSMLILSSIITFVAALRYVPEGYRSTPVFYFLIAILALGPFVRTNSTTQLCVWPPFEKPVRSVQLTPWPLRTRQRAALESMKKHIKPMEMVYVLPPSVNDVHFFLQTRYTSYGFFYPNPLTDVLQQPGLQGVIVLNRKEIFPFYRNLSDRLFQYDQAEEILRSHQYEPVAEVSTMVLWRKASPLKNSSKTDYPPASP
jgi:hypothetical protein